MRTCALLCQVGGNHTPLQLGLPSSPPQPGRLPDNNIKRPYIAAAQHRHTHPSEATRHQLTPSLMLLEDTLLQHPDVFHCVTMCSHPRKKHTILLQALGCGNMSVQAVDEANKDASEQVQGCLYVGKRSSCSVKHNSCTRTFSKCTGCNVRSMRLPSAVNTSTDAAVYSPGTRPAASTQLKLAQYGPRFCRSRSTCWQCMHKHHTHCFKTTKNDANMLLRRNSRP